MKLSIGTTRKVYSNEQDAIKIPNASRSIIKLGNFLDFFTTLPGIKNKWECVKGFFLEGESSPASLRAALAGMAANWREGQYPPELEDIIVPTKLSVFGLLNVQDAAEDLPQSLTHEQFRGIIAAALKGTSIDRHTFFNRLNYGVHEGRVKLRDYGGIDIVGFLTENHLQIRKALESISLELHPATPQGEAART